MTDKIKKFIDTIVPITTCNLKCHYCYITLCKKFSDSIVPLKYSPEHIANALSQKRLGGICCINFCGAGETLLQPEMPKLIEEILKQGHYVMVVTNGTYTKAFEEIAKINSDLLKRLFFKFSFQYLELKRLNMVDKFFANIRRIDECGCSFSLEITPNDELIPYIDEVKTISLNNLGALPHVSVARDSRKEELPILTKYDKNTYKKIWIQFQSKMFEYKLSVFNKKRKEFCYAGAWSYFLDIGTGILKQCYCGEPLQNIFEDTESPIISEPVGYSCPEPHCFNAHAWLTWGDIPEHKAPTYLEMRDRKTCNGMTWVKEPIKSFFQTKLKDHNKEMNMLTKFKHNKNIKTLLNNTFSVKNEYLNNIKRKVVTILGIKLKFKIDKPLKKGIYVYHKVNWYKNDENTVSLFKFLFQMIILKLKKEKVVPLNEYNNNGDSIVLTFDDGDKTICKYVAPILNLLKFPYEIFVCDNFVSLAENGNSDYLNVSDLKSLVKNGAHIQYHSKSHIDLTQLLSETEILSEIICPDYIKDIDKDGCSFFAYPYWKNNTKLKNIISKYYTGARSGNGYADNSCYSMDSIKMK